MLFNDFSNAFIMDGFILLIYTIVFLNSSENSFPSKRWQSMLYMAQRGFAISLAKRLQDAVCHRISYFPQYECITLRLRQVFDVSEL